MSIKFKIYRNVNDLPYVCCFVRGIILAKIYEDFSKTNVKEMFVNLNLENKYKKQILQLFNGEIEEFEIN